jgi:phage terminase small subunit
MNLMQQAFVREYVRDLNGTKAAMRAGYSKKTARSIANRLLTKADIKAAVKARQERRYEKVDIKADDVLRELRRIAFQDLSGVIRVERGSVYLSDTAVLTEDQMAAIESFEPTQHGVKVRLHSKEKALELLARHMGMLTDKVEHSGSLNVKHTMTDAELEEIAAGKPCPPA